jgi:ankyrin repeat protein
MTPCINTLLKMKADIATQDKEGNSLLHYAAAMDSVEVSKVLLQAKINPSVTNRNGQTARELITNTNRDLAEVFDGTK